MKKLFFTLLIMFSFLGNSQSLVDLTMEEAVALIEGASNEVLGIYDGVEGQIMKSTYEDTFALAYFPDKGLCSNTILYINETVNVPNLRHVYDRDYHILGNDRWVYPAMNQQIIITVVDDIPVVMFGRYDQ